MRARLRPPLDETDSPASMKVGDWTHDDEGLRWKPWVVSSKEEYRRAFIKATRRAGIALRVKGNCHSCVMCSEEKWLHSRVPKYSGVFILPS